MAKKIKCFGCEKVLEKGEKYKIGLAFDEIVCEECEDEYKQQYIETESWHDLMMWDSQEYKIVT